MFASVQKLTFVAAALLFILSLRGLSAQGTARRGNAYGALGMALAVGMAAAGVWLPGSRASGEGLGALTLLVAVATGAVCGSAVAMRVAMTSMPELVAILHSF